MYKLVIEIYHEDESVLRGIERRFELDFVDDGFLDEQDCSGCSTSVTNSEEEV